MLHIARLPLDRKLGSAYCYRWFNLYIDWTGVAVAMVPELGLFQFFFFIK